ncbi:hypothetical protein [Actinobacillus equuli]|uniref:Uncharacterized protein n=1 Tax=Actinobacillus equuli TaxID=718 RepID=A0AAX3FIH5_ACTEU|nr:hypothetical protein [Actinobacillus equuli]AIZ79934.1 hypothetical protein ACEE_09245 [Actinobacillus equuli subsp. equuli]WGE44049.1 hypothetical protein NYR65_09135 [Actinobacillus equuli subsp. equuli]VEE90948.1 Uncharacterised protein [Actinobacillus equuli]
MSKNNDTMELDTIEVTGKLDDSDKYSREKSDDNNHHDYTPSSVWSLNKKLTEQAAERIDKVYSGFPTGKGFYIVIHEYKDTIIGHTNIEFVHNAKRDGWFGANTEKIELGNITGGIFPEYMDSQSRIRYKPNKHSYQVIEVSKESYSKALIEAQKMHENTNAKKEDYDIIGKAHNCVDFSIDILKKADIKNSEKIVANFMQGKTLASGYAEVVSLITNGIPENIAYEKVFSNNEFQDFKNMKYDDIPRIIGKYSNSTGFNSILFNKGDSNDTYEINTNKNIIISDSGGNDTLNIHQDFSKLLFRKSGNDLKIIDTTSSNALLVQNWFNLKTEMVATKRWKGGLKRRFVTVNEMQTVPDNSHKIEKIVANGKYSLSYDKVDKLIEAMAIFKDDGSFAIPEYVRHAFIRMPNPEISKNLTYIQDSWEEIK